MTARGVLTGLAALAAALILTWALGAIFDEAARQAPAEGLTWPSSLLQGGWLGPATGG